MHTIRRQIAALALFIAACGGSPDTPGPNPRPDTSDATADVQGRPCEDVTCGFSEQCHPRTGTCASCLTDENCVDRREPYCYTDNPAEARDNRCVECYRDTHCPSGMRCRGYGCEDRDT